MITRCKTVNIVYEERPSINQSMALPFLPSVSLCYTLIVRKSLSTRSFQRNRGLPMDFLPLDALFVAWKKRLAFYRRRICPSRHIFPLLVIGMTSASLYLSLSSMFFKIFHALFSWMSQNLFFKILFWNVYSAFIDLFDKIQVSEQYRTSKNDRSVTT